MAMHSTETYNQTKHILTLIVFIAISSFLHSFSFSIVIFSIYLFFYFSQDKKNSLFYSSLFFGLFYFENFFKIDTVNKKSFYSISSLTNLNSSWNVLTSKIFCLFLYFLIVFIFFKLQNFNWKKKVTILTLPFLFSFFTLQMDNRSFFFTTLTLLTIMISKSIFYIIYYYECLKLNIGTFSFKNFFQPFCYPTSEICIPTPRYSQLKSNIENNLIIKSLLSILFYKTAGLIMANFLNFFILKNNSLIHDEVLFFNEKFHFIFNSGFDFGVIDVAIIILGYGFLYLQITFFTYSRLLFLLLRFIGFSIPDTINSPEKSVSFSDFFSRTMFYYNTIINYFFYYPLISTFRKLNVKISNSALLFLALLIGGLYIHALKDIHKIFQYGLHTYFLLLFQNILPYLAVLSLAIVTSHRFEKNKNTHYFKVFLYLFGYCLIVSLTTMKHFKNFYSFINFYFGWIF